MGATQSRSDNPILRTEKLTKKFGSIQAVNKIDVQVYSDEFTAIIGPNGAGKTTLLRLLTGDMRPTSGSVFFNGKDITSLKQHEVCDMGLGKSFQIPSVFGNLSVLENIRLSLQRSQNKRLSIFRNKHTFENDISQAQKILRNLHLEKEKGNLAQNLSHGDKRKLDIGIALAVGSKMLLLDEPLAGMSESESNRVVDLIEKLNNDYALVAVEHNINFILEYADRIIVLERGEIIANGTPQEIRENERVQDAYLGS